VEITLEKNDWERDFDDRGVWVVQTGEPGETVDYGVVSDGFGFEDSPDCERISGGINTKGPQAVAIGRQANMLQWGFYAAPDRMTESARRVFLNALVYMTRFDGHAPLVEKVATSRDRLTRILGRVRELDGMEHEERRSFFRYLSDTLPADWVTAVGLDAGAFERRFEAELEYVYKAEDERAYRIDAALRELGVSNRTPAFLELLERRLADDPTDAVALELAERYLGEAGHDAPSALRFLREHEGRLYFSDTGGYRWFVNPLVESER